MTPQDLQRVEQFRELAFRPAGSRTVTYTANRYFQNFYIDGKCYEAGFDNPYTPRATMVGAISISSVHQAVQFQHQNEMLLKGTACIEASFPGTRAIFRYYTSPAAYAAALAERQRDPRYTVRAAQPQRSQHACAIFLDVQDHRIRHTETLILAPPGQALAITDKPGTACAIRGATASLGMLGMLDLPDDRVLHPDFVGRYRTGFVMLYRANFGHWLFWNVKLEPGMTEEEAIAAVSNSPELISLRKAKLFGEMQ